MSYRAGDAYVSEFTTSNPTTLAAQNADTTPVATANNNGTDDASFVLTVANLDTGRYKVTGTVPNGYSPGDVVNITVAVTVAGVTGKLPIDGFVLEGRPVTLPSPAPSGYGPGGGAGTTAVTDLAGGSNRSPSNMTVKDQSGNPIFGAVVQAYVASAYSANPATAAAQCATTTDANGHWTINPVTGSGALTLVISYPGDQTQVLLSAVTV
ncbi:MAG: hypothetical protein P4L84_33635 [Isosphaeraceae bacterium]|nr:hypothetical protein [Isosphaeraceae bacterium]